MGETRNDPEPLASPARFSSDSFTPSPNPTGLDRESPLGAEEEQERLKYRSWRQTHLRGRPGRSRSAREGDVGWISRKIQATLPNLDAPASRSRKSSHYLGLFKEKDVAEEERRRNAHSRSSDALPTPTEAPGRSQGVYQALAHGGPKTTTKLSYSKSQPNLKAILALDVPFRPRPRSRHDFLREYGVRPKTSPDTKEDSAREHISSALYFPHRQIRPDLSPELVGQDQLMRTQSASGPNQLHDIVENFDGVSPDAVEISLQSEDESRLWKGDLAESIDSDSLSGHEYDPYSSGSDHDGFATAYESETDDEQRTPKAGSHPNYVPRVPVGAVELKPFDHQVGGHSTVYRFSRRAVCKQLNNRENVFYETVEKYHPDLLEFMPRYVSPLVRT
jgi:inositol-hexakisphosphate kinase